MVLPSPILARKDFGSNGGLRLVAIAGGLARSIAPRILQLLGAPDSAGRIDPPLAGIDRLNPPRQFSQWIHLGALFCPDAKARQGAGTEDVGERPIAGTARRNWHGSAHLKRAWICV